jgi:hypothetical protein
MGASRWSAGIKPSGFDRKAPERNRKFERMPASFGRRKALKGEAHERWELKEASQGDRG